MRSACVALLLCDYYCAIFFEKKLTRHSLGCTKTHRRMKLAIAIFLCLTIGVLAQANGCDGGKKVIVVGAGTPAFLMIIMLISDIYFLPIHHWQACRAWPPPSN
jgi:hypothetical protein